MRSNPSKAGHSEGGHSLTSQRGEKISAVEGLTLTPRMRELLEQTKDRPGEERRALIRAKFLQKSG
jgi:hypothetical protein